MQCQNNLPFNNGRSYIDIALGATAMYGFESDNNAKFVKKVTISVIHHG